ncbi:MAG TPA: hypothetical protein VHX14_06095 [Thermoanaerobaculia bacterium]|nr:hypothetical protein [Thermoanaerobaculia bacterium]
MAIISVPQEDYVLRMRWTDPRERSDLVIGHVIMQSKTTIGTPAALECGEETYAIFEPAILSSEQIKSPFKDLGMRSSDVPLNQVADRVEVGCLP